MRRNAVAAALAAIIVLAAAAFAGSHLRVAQTQTEPPGVTAERVVVKRVVVGEPQPKLHINSEAQSMPAPAPTAATADSSLAPQIARTGKVSLFAAGVDKTVSALTTIAHRQGGDVFSLQVSNADAAAKASAEIEIRVPASRFDDAMAAVAQTGKVRERSATAEDLTGDITDSSARLRNLRRTEADIRKIMDRSGTIAQVLDAENQLSQVREQIETLESSLKSMHAQVAYSTIDVSIEAEAATVPIEPTAASQLAQAWQDAVHALSQTTVGLVASVLWLIVFAPYALMIGLMAFVAYAQLRKRFRGATMAP